MLGTLFVSVSVSGVFGLVLLCGVFVVIVMCGVSVAFLCILILSGYYALLL